MTTVKKEIRWFSYVDRILDERFQDLLHDLCISNQAHGIRICIEILLDCVDQIKTKRGMPPNFSEKDLRKSLKSAIENFETPKFDFITELKQRLSPLKTSILMLTQFKGETAQGQELSEQISHIEKVITELENFFKFYFKEPQSSRFLDVFDVLHVEDNELERKTITKYFEFKGAKIKSVETVEQALEILKISTPKVMLFDLSLKTSNMDGDALCKTLKSKPEYRSIPIFLITAVIPEGEKLATLEATGAIGIIFKPIASLAELDSLFKYL